MRSPTNQPCVLQQSGQGRSAFSLVELLAVIAIIATLSALMVPAINSHSGVAGRRGAVNTIMNTLEQARVAALESGRDVYVVFWRRDFPEADAIGVFRETETGSGNYEQLSRWLPLPKRIMLHKPEQGRNIFHESTGLPSSFALNRVFFSGGATATATRLGVIQYSASGTLLHPSNSRDALIILAEGQRTDGTEKVTLNSPDFEIISVAKYTGRPTLEITAIPTDS
jgi:prepilin-type N-terminal cleavage/methylation domain-containing protein